MSRRTYLLVVSGLTLVVCALLLTDRLLWRPGLTEDNVRRVRPGMTLAEVEALRGRPATETIDRHTEGEPPQPAARALAATNRTPKAVTSNRHFQPSLGSAKNLRKAVAAIS
jgi:hypothetical protein